MNIKKETYFRTLSEGGVLDERAVADLRARLELHLRLDKVPEELLRRSNDQHKITDYLTRLDPRVATGPKSWGGLVIGFPGSPRQLTTQTLGTPYLRKILYPALDLHQRLNAHYGRRLPCLYLLGARFPDVVLRKFRLLAQVIPHLIVLTSDLLNAVSTPVPECSDSRTEQFVQTRLCTIMQQEGLKVPVEGGELRLRYLAHELPTGEGTREPERLDILAVDETDRSLVAFEIKGPHASRVELENLFLQGLEHRDWLERNKMGVKLLVEGPKGTGINSKKRVRLVLGSFGTHVPDLFWALRRQAMRYDRYLQIDFVRFDRTDEGGKLVLSRPIEPT